MNEEFYENEINRLKRNFDKYRKEDAGIKRQMFMYLYICLVVSVFSCSMMAYVIFTGDQKVSIVLNNEETDGSEEITVDSSEGSGVVEDDDNTETSSEDLSIGSVDTFIEDESNENTETEYNPPSTNNTTSNSFGLPRRTHSEDASFGLPRSNSSEKRVRRITYYVKKDDNLWNISNKFYKSPRYIEKIKRDNSLVSNSLIPGTKLILIIEN
jgi:hypothetical protein